MKNDNEKNRRTARQTAQKYADIIGMEYTRSAESLRRHPPMTLQNRAKIFSPFAALRGYDEQLAEEKQRSERVHRRILTEEEMNRLSDKLLQLHKGMTVTVRYFKEDTAHPEQPPVGVYVDITGRVQRIDSVCRTLQIAGVTVPFGALDELIGDGIREIDEFLGISEE